MSNFNVYLLFPEYLAQWITNSFGSPAVLIKDSPEARLLNELTCKLPFGKEPDSMEGNNVAIAIPWFKGKNPEIFNYITDTGKNALIESFSTLFKKTLLNEITDLKNGHVKRSTLIYIFMERHGINEKHWDTIAKIHNRAATKYLREKKIKIS